MVDRRHATPLASIGSFGVKIPESLPSENLMLPNFLFRNQPSQFISIINLVLTANVVQNKRLIKFIFNSALSCSTFVIICSIQYLESLLTPFARDYRPLICSATSHN